MVLKRSIYWCSRLLGELVTRIRECPFELLAHAHKDYANLTACALGVSIVGLVKHCRLQKVYSPSFFHKTEPPFSILEKNLLLLWILWSVSSDIEMDVSDFRARQKDQAHLVSINATLINWLFPRYDRAH
jgi:hypothetical protein